MTSIKRALQAAAGAAAGEALYVEDVFSTYLYTGNGSTQTITNGIDLAGEGGLVWIKERAAAGATNHALMDTVRGGRYILSSSTSGAELTASISEAITGFNSDGFDLGGTYSNSYRTNTSSNTYASWTFRKAPKFFDVVTYTGNGTAGRTVAHNLGSVPGMIIVKKTSSATSSTWYVYHVSTGNAAHTLLNTTAATDTASSGWNSTTPTATEFTLGANVNVNQSGETFVAYLFASDAGGFGDDDESIIKCGSYTGNSSTNDIDLGFEPQWLLIKDASSANNWQIFDSMRGIVTGGNDQRLAPNNSDQEFSTNMVDLLATGFQLQNNTVVNNSGSTYIYIAIRRPMKTPESGTEVFAIDTRTATTPAFTSNFPVDFFTYRDKTGSDWYSQSRLTGGGTLYFNSTGAENSIGGLGNENFDYQDGVMSSTANLPNLFSYMFKRATGFFDVVAYSGSSQDTVVLDSISWKQQPHNLGVAPEFIIVKSRSTTYNWWVFHKDLPDYNTQNRYVAQLNSTNAAIVSNIFGGDSTSSSEPNANYWYMPAGSQVNASGQTFIAYLFATLAGVSKVGSYTGNGTSQTIDCGFSGGARFILIKSTSTTGSWWVYDSARGIVAGNDPALQLNSTAAEVTSADAIDPDSSGFIVNQEATCSINASGVSYIFMSIA